MGRVRKWLVCLCMTMSLLVGMAVVPIAAEETDIEKTCTVVIDGNGGLTDDGEQTVTRQLVAGKKYDLRGLFKKSKAVEERITVLEASGVGIDFENPMCVSFNGSDVHVRIEWLETGVDVAAVFYSYDWNKNTRNMYRIVDTSAEFEVPELPESTLEGTENLYWRCVSGGGVDVLPGEHVTLTENAAYMPYMDAETGILFCAGNEQFADGSRFAVCTELPFPEFSAKSLTGKTLFGWNTELDGMGIFYDMESVAPEIGDKWITIYAQWAGKDDKLVTLYDELSDTTNMFAGVPGTEIILPSLQKQGYRFLGWQEWGGKSIYRERYRIPEDSSFCMLSAVWEQLLYQPATVICDASSMKICIPAAQTIPETVKRIVLSAYEHGRMVCSVTGILQTDGASQRIVCEVPESLAGESDTWKVFALDDAWSPVLKAEILTFQS